MADKHSQTFFGSKVGLIINSSGKEKPNIYVQCIRKKNDSQWEKPSQNEGKTIKLSIEEIIQILSVLSMNAPQWSTVHTFNGDTTKISVNWDEKNDAFWMGVNDYRRMLRFPQSRFLEMLLDHILREKIEFATT